MKISFRQLTDSMHTIQNIPSAKKAELSQNPIPFPATVSTDELSSDPINANSNGHLFLT
jgi:hypothetical protein